MHWEFFRKVPRVHCEYVRRFRGKGRTKKKCTPLEQQMRFVQVTQCVCTDLDKNVGTSEGSPPNGSQPNRALRVGLVGWGFVCLFVGLILFWG